MGFRVTGVRTTLRPSYGFRPCHAHVGLRGVKEEPRPSLVGACARNQAAPPARARLRPQGPPSFTNPVGSFSPFRSMRRVPKSLAIGLDPHSS